MRPRVERLIELLGLEEVGERAPSETSVGQQQRAALARALVLSPRLLLADEPTGHQDALSARAVFRALREATAGGTCCLVATHNEEAEALFDVVLTMANGGINDSAQPRALLRVRGPGGSAPTSGEHA